MKRFFCSVCKKVKRVQKWPATLDTNHADSTNPVDRIGECNWHMMGRASLKSNPKSRVAVIKSTTKKRAS